MVPADHPCGRPFVIRPVVHPLDVRAPGREAESRHRIDSPSPIRHPRIRGRRIDLETHRKARSVTAVSTSTEVRRLRDDESPLPVPRTSERHQDDRSATLMRSIEDVYRDQFRTFHRVATAITGDAELGLDAVQEAFARTIRRRTDFRGDGPLEGWIWRAVINVAKDHRRRARTMVQTPEFADMRDPSDGPADRADVLVRERIAALPERQRTALFLRYYVDMSYADIGHALDIRTGTVSATLNAAHKTLRAGLEGAADDHPADGRSLPRRTAAATRGCRTAVAGGWPNGQLRGAR
jgi:RNA polymerase sigma-70 factor (ECF subfamily)